MVMMQTLFILIASVTLHAQQNLPNLLAAPQVVNQILFSEADQSWTLRDFKIYKRLLATLTKKEKIADFSENALDDFVVTRLLKREALLFEIAPQSLVAPLNLKGADGEVFSSFEIEQETGMIAEALALLELKQNQMGQRVRFKAWTDVLKRKYSVKMKTSEP